MVQTYLHNTVLQKEVVLKCIFAYYLIFVQFVLEVRIGVVVIITVVSGRAKVMDNRWRCAGRIGGVNWVESALMMTSGGCCRQWSVLCGRFNGMKVAVRFPRPQILW